MYYVADQGILVHNQCEAKPGSPALKGDPYSPAEVSRRQSELRRKFGIEPDPDVPIPDQPPGRNIKSTHSADNTDAMGLVKEMWAQWKNIQGGQRVALVCPKNHNSHS